MEKTRRSVLRKSAIASTIGVSGLAGCAQGGDGSDNTDTPTDDGDTGGTPTTTEANKAQGIEIKVGSKRFSTQKLYSYMSILALQERTEANIVDETGLGGTAQIWRAIQNDSIQHYWTYTLNIWQTFSGHEEVIQDPDEIYQKSVEVVNNDYPKLKLLEPTDVLASWTIVVRPDWADEHGITKISDFAEYIKDGNTDFTFVTYAEFAERPDGIPALLDTYDIPEDLWNQINVKKVGYGPLNYQILNNEQAVATSGWLTQPQIFQYGFNTLEDDKGFTSASRVVPVVQKHILENNDIVEETINEVAGTMTTEDIRAKVLRITNSDDTPKQIAREHLKAHDVI